MASLGSPITAVDLQLTRTRDAEPVSQDYRGVTLPCPADAGGFPHLQSLAFCPGWTASPPPSSAARYHLWRAVAQAFFDWKDDVDPDFARSATSRLSTQPGEKKAQPSTTSGRSTAYKYWW